MNPQYSDFLPAHYSLAEKQQAIEELINTLSSHYPPPSPSVIMNLKKNLYHLKREMERGGVK